MAHLFESWRDRVGRYEGETALVVGPGPGFDDVPLDLMVAHHHLFILNHAMTVREFQQHPNHWWVSNDHDRTFQNAKIRAGVAPRLESYKPWRTITNKKFLPGKIGSFRWLDHKGRWQDPFRWKLPLPKRPASSVVYYEQTPGREDYLRNGDGVLELALEIITQWGFSRAVLVGVDMIWDGGKYYGNRWAWKEEPPKMRAYRMGHCRESIAKNRGRWLDDVRLVSTLYPDPCPFERVEVANLPTLLKSAVSLEGVHHGA